MTVQLDLYACRQRDRPGISKINTNKQNKQQPNNASAKQPTNKTEACKPII